MRRTSQMAIANPYIKKDIYSSQATAAKGIRSAVPVRFYMGGTISEPIQEVSTEEDVQKTIYAPKSVVDPKSISLGPVGDPGVVGPDTTMEGSGQLAVSMAINMATGNLLGLLGNVADIGLSAKTGKLGNLPDLSIMGLAKKGIDTITGKGKGSITEAENAGIIRSGGYAQAWGADLGAGPPVSGLDDIELGEGGNGEGGFGTY
jgi:hypothetical protein